MSSPAPTAATTLFPGYFSSEKHAALTAPNGASLSPDVVDLLAGSPTPWQYAQAQQTSPPDAIGKVEKVVGNATVIRNGVAVILHVGDAVYKSDVVQTGANSSVGVGFADGTALNLVANTRMALNEYSFDASGTSNSALFTLVEGTFAFVAGKVAHGDHMKISTPVATMGIRGTIGLAEQFTADLGQVGFAIFEGAYTLVEQGIDVSQPGLWTLLTPQGPGLPPLVANRPFTDLEAQFAQGVINGAVQIQQLIGLPTPPSGLGSPTLPEFDLPLVLPENGGTGGPFIFTNSVPGLTAPTVYTVFVIEVVTPITSLPSPTTTPSSSGAIIWNAAAPGSDWGSGPDWIGGNVPGATNNVEILVPATVTIDAPEAANSLVVADDDAPNPR